MDFAEQIAALNEWHFFSEFTYSKPTFCPLPSQQVELADSIMWIANILLVYQLKEREPRSNPSPEAERRWFEKKVLGKATKQVRDTLSYLKTASPIEVRNHRGHVLRLDARLIRQLHKLVVYLPNQALPHECRHMKHHRSQTAGLIHVIAANDYLGIVRTLLTPAEVADYLEFREALISRAESQVVALPEQALVGQYISGNLESMPSRDFIQHLTLLDHLADEWDMSGIISKFPDRATAGQGGTDYYHIIRELALLKRNELREFKTRFQLCLAKARANEMVRPYRFAIPRTGCGFVFVPITKQTLPHRRKGLQNFALANKYDLKLLKCIGVSIADDSGGYFTTEWIYLESPWEPDPGLEEALRTNNPFREVKAAELPRYAFKSVK